MICRTVEEMEQLQTSLLLRLVEHGGTMTSDERKRTEAHLEAVDEVLTRHRELTSKIATPAHRNEVSSNG